MVPDNPEKMKQFIRKHFEEFVNRRNLEVADVNFAPDFVDHGSDVPRARRLVPRERSCTWAARSKDFPTCMSLSKT